MRQAPDRADDLDMGQKVGIGFLGVMLLGVTALYAADFSGGLPFLSGEPARTTPAYVDAIGTPAAIELPGDVDIEAWFAGPGDDDGASPDPYDPARWKAVSNFLAQSTTREGWAETCAAASSAAGADREEAPLPGALACSDIPSVTLAQQFAARVLWAQAEVALWMRGARDTSPATVSAIQGELRLMCTTEVVAREGPDSAFTEACTLALDTAYLEGDPPATFAALAQAYELAATEIALRDPTIETEPAFYDVAAP